MKMLEKIKRLIDWLKKKEKICLNLEWNKFVYIKNNIKLPKQRFLRFFSHDSLVDYVMVSFTRRQLSKFEAACKKKVAALRFIEAISSAKPGEWVKVDCRRFCYTKTIEEAHGKDIGAQIEILDNILEKINNA